MGHRSEFFFVHNEIALIHHTLFYLTIITYSISRYRVSNIIFSRTMFMIFCRTFFVQDIIFLTRLMCKQKVFLFFLTFVSLSISHALCFIFLNFLHAVLIYTPTSFTFSRNISPSDTFFLLIFFSKKDKKPISYISIVSRSAF